MWNKTLIMVIKCKHSDKLDLIQHGFIFKIMNLNLVLINPLIPGIFTEILFYNS